MPSERDAPIQPNWRPTLNLPQLRSCERCGAVCDTDGLAVHDKWHVQLTNVLFALESLTIGQRRLG